jgi:hypothetical protein
VLCCVLGCGGGALSRCVLFFLRFLAQAGVLLAAAGAAAAAGATSFGFSSDVWGV